MLPDIYDFEINQIIGEIKRICAKKVLLHLPAGLCPYATSITEKIKAPGMDVFIWASPCFGACDAPCAKGIDLIVQFGHNKFRKD